jgi:hypothetical protein
VLPTISLGREFSDRASGWRCFLDVSIFGNAWNALFRDGQTIVVVDQQVDALPGKPLLDYMI